MFLRSIRLTSFRSIKPLTRSITTKVKPIKPISYNFTKYAVLSIGTIGLTLTLTSNNQFQNDSSKINDDINSIISVDSSVDPFPKVINGGDGDGDLKTDFELLGYGIRTVTFLKMKVYALGIYIANEDKPIVEKVFNSKYLESIYESKTQGTTTTTTTTTHQDHLKLALQDSKLSVLLIDNLLNSGVKLTARIVPVRNTDFNHLRDGLIKSIKSNPKYKELVNDGFSDELLSSGLDELRSAFGKVKMTAYKNSQLYLELIENGKLRLSFKQYNVSLKKFENSFEMGVVCEPLISKLLFLSYLSGDKPLSEPTRNQSIEGFINIV